MTDSLTVALPGSARTSPIRPRRPRAWMAVTLDLAAAWAGSALLLAPAPHLPPTLVVHAVVASVWVALLSATRCYPSGAVPGDRDGGRRAVRAGTALLALLTLAAALAPGIVAEQPTPGDLLLLCTLVTAVAVVQRSPALARAHVGRTARHRPSRAVVAGHGRDVARVLAELASDRHHRLEVAAVCIPPSSGTRFEVPVVRGFDLLPSIVAEQDVDVAIVLPCHHFDPAALRRLGWQLERAGVHLVVASALLDVDRSRARTVRAGGLQLVHVRHADLTGARRVAKQVWERVAAALALAVLAPALIVVAVAIRLDSPGPALFRQVRTGKDGVPFVMLKLRTMTAGAEDLLGGLVADGGSSDVLFKLRSDPRVTRLGRVLRRYSVDEVPQLLNVLRGEMSLVGPRPPLATEVLAYDGDTLRRLAVRPGMTGLWQVSGRSDLPWEETVRLDLRYVDNWSLTLDALIIARTLTAVLGHRGAY